MQRNPRRRALLVAALEAGGVIEGLPGDTRTSVFEALVQHLPLPKGVDASSMLQVLIARDALGSTNVGNGIGIITHARSPVRLPEEGASIMVFFLARPVDFGSGDGERVHVLLSVWSPSVKVHLDLLARLAFALQNGELRSVLMRHGSREDIVKSARAVEAVYEAGR